MLEIYALTGGKIFYQVLNAISAFFGTSSWSMIIRWSLNITVISGIIKFIGTKDLVKLIRWAFIYIFILSILVFPKKSVHIVDLSDSTAVYKVDNVPIGAAILFSFSTRIGFGLAELYDQFFSVPDALTYSKTGFLFGANLVRDSLSPNIMNSSMGKNINGYITSCVVGDVMLNYKYSLNELFESDDVFDLITSNPSPVRRTSFDDINMSCKEAASAMKTAFNNYFSKSGIIALINNTGAYNSGLKEAALRQLLEDSYSFFYGSSKNAVQILKNSVTNSAIKHGISSFGGKQGDVAGLIMTTAESSQLKSRLNWAVSAKIATTYLPMLHTVMLLLLFGLLPIIILLTVSDIMGTRPLKLYALSLLYFMSWLPLYSILNYVMIFYTKSSLEGINPTLENTDRTKLILSDISMIAGYLSLSIPFLALGIVKGFSAVATNASGFLTSTISGAVSQVSSSAMDGNWSLGNVSTQNVQGFKWDTNYSHASGNMTQQLSNGATRTITADGTTGINTNGIQSYLPTSATLSQSHAEQYQRAVRFAESWATNAQEGFNQSNRNLFSNLSQLQHALNKGRSHSKGYNQDELTTLKEYVSSALSIVDRYSQEHNVSNQTAVSELNFKSRSAHFGGSYLVVGGNLTSGSQHNLANNSSDTDQSSKSKGSDLVDNWSSVMDKLSSYKLSYNGSETDNYNQAYINNINTSYENAISSMKAYQEAKSAAFSLAKESSEIVNGNTTITSNLNNEFVGWMKKNYPLQFEEILSNTSDSNIAMEREQLYKQFINSNINGRINNIMGFGAMGQAYRQQYDSTSKQMKNDTGLAQTFNDATSQTNTIFDENGTTINDGSNSINANNKTFEQNYNQTNVNTSNSINQVKENLTDKNTQSKENYDASKEDTNKAINMGIRKQGNPDSGTDRRILKNKGNAQHRLNNSNILPPPGMR